jgi:hypothetical protein
MRQSQTGSTGADSSAQKKEPMQIKGVNGITRMDAKKAPGYEHIIPPKYAGMQVPNLQY